MLIQTSRWKALQAYLLAAPQFLVLLAFLVVPILMVVVISFWNFNGFAMTPGFTLDHYKTIFSSQVYLATYLSTFRFILLVWPITVVIGFAIAYFQAFHIKRLETRILLFLIVIIPFWTSNIIRMISWVPFLGREGLLNSMLLWLGVIQEPIEIFLFSDFSVVLTLVHLYTPLMIVTIFNSMVRIDKSLIAAAQDAGASGFQVLKDVIIPLSAPGIATGSIFIITLIMGEFVTVRLMSGGQSASVGYLIQTQIESLQYPVAAANAVLLLIVALSLVTLVLRVVDIRKEL